MMSSAYVSEHELVESLLRRLRPRLVALPEAIQDKGGDLGPLTEIDLLVDHEFRSALAEHYPRDGWLSEESQARPGAADARVWIVDPVDGTRELVAGIPEWAVSVGLWSATGEPLAGWIYNPPSDRLWFGIVGHGCWRDGTPIRVRRADRAEELIVGVSRTDTAKGRIPAVEPPPRPVGSIAYKLALVADGTLDATVSVTPKHLWDVAGGIALVLAAGGRVVRFDDGTPLDRLPIDLTDPILPGGLVAAHPDWISHLRRLYGAP